jgi:hypothetical protein
MRRVRYAGLDFATDDRVAAALIEYVGVLALLNAADVVSIPGVDEAGVVRDFELLLGPANPILVVPTDGQTVPMAVENAVHELQRRSSSRLPSTEDLVLSSWELDDEDQPPD